jgi:hypothetical protein
MQNYDEHHKRGSTVTRPRVEVQAGATAQAVLLAGGLICDMAMNGAEVTVLVPRGADARPLRILGAKIQRRTGIAKRLGAARVLVQIDLTEGYARVGVGSAPSALYEPVDPDSR